MNRWLLFTILFALLACPALGQMARFTPDRPGDYTGRQRDRSSLRLVPQTGLDGSTTCAAYSPNGKLLFTGNSIGTAQEWFVPDGVLDRTFAFDASEVKALLVADNGALIVSSDSGKTYAADIETGKLLWSADGSSAAFGLSHDEIAVLNDLQIDILDASTGKTIRSWQISNGAERVPDVLVSNGAELAGLFKSAGISTETEFKVWNIASGNLLGACPNKLSGPDSQITACVLSNSGQLFAVGDTSNAIQIWDIKSRKLLRTIHGVGGEPREGGPVSSWQVGITALAFSSDGKSIAAGDRARTAQIFDVSSGKQIGRFGLPDGLVTSLRYSPDGKRLFMANDQAGIWRTGTRTLEGVLPGGGYPVHDVQFSPDGAYLMAAGDDGAVRVWNVADRSLVQTLSKRQGAVTYAMWTPDGKSIVDCTELGPISIFQDYGKPERAYRGISTGDLVSSDEPAGLDRCDDGPITIWNVATGQGRPLRSSPESTPTALAFIDSNTVIAAEGAGGIAARNTVTGKLVHLLDFTLMGANVQTLAVSPDSSVLVIASDTNYVSAWSVNGWRQLWKRKMKQQVSRLVFSSDAKNITVRYAGGPNALDVFYTSSGAVDDAFKMSGISDGFSPEDNHLGDNGMRDDVVIVKRPTGEMLDCYNSAADRSFLNARFSPDGKILAIAGPKQEVELYDAESGQPFANLVVFPGKDLPGPYPGFKVEPGLSWMAYAPDEILSSSPDAGSHYYWIYDDLYYPGTMFEPERQLDKVRSLLPPQISF